MNPIPLSRGTQLVPYVEFLERLGAPVERGFEKYRLPRGEQPYAEALVSTRALFSFVEAMGRQEGVDDFGWRAATATQLSPGLQNALRSAPTLLQALERASALCNTESSMARTWIVSRGNSAYFCHRGSLELGVSGASEANLMRTGVAISIIRMFAGPDWVPTETGLVSDRNIGSLMREALRDGKVCPATNYGWVRFPRSLLALPPRPQLQGEARSKIAQDTPPAQDLAGSLEQFLSPYIGERMPTLREAAEMVGTSSRSLQRSLVRSNTSYRDVLNRVRFRYACERLNERHVKVLEIADATGFINPAHFTRFFRSFAGVSPQEYRVGLSGP